MMHFLFQNMLQIIQQSPSGLPPNLTRNYTYQLLKALFACHSRNIIHQDVKPENMLVTSDNVLKLCDFGYAVRSVNSNGTSSNLESSVYTEFIATRWYRSPEVLLGARCGKDADMWSAGCIVGEMADGRPLFPGQSELDQLFVIQTVLGPLSTRQRNMFYTSPRYTQLRLPTVAKASKGLDKRYRHKMCAKLLDCMKGLLAIDACNRLDVNQALRHKVFIPEVAMDASNANHRSNHHTPTVTSSSPALHSHRSSDDQGSPYLDSGGEGSPTQHYGSGAGKANRHSIAVHMNEVANKRAPTSNMENRKDYGSLRKPMRDPSQKVLKRTTSNKDTLFGAYRDAHQSKVTCDTQPNSSPNDNQNQQPKYSYMPLKSNSSNSSGSNKQANNQSSSFIQDAINSFWTDGPNSILAPPSNLQHLNAATPGLSQSQGQTNKQQPLNNLDIRQKADPKIDSYQFSQTGVVRPAKFSPGGGDTLPFADDLEASMLSIEAAVDTTLEKIARNNNIYNGHRFATDESFKSSRDTESQAKDSTLRASQFENPSDDIYSRSVPPAIAADDFCEDFEDEMDAEFSEEPITKEMKPVSPYHSRVDRLKVGSQFDRRPHSSGDNKPMLCDAELSDETGSSGPSVGDVANITSGASHDKTFSENERPESETKLVAPIAPLVDESFDLEYQCDQILESNITRSGTWCDEDRSREPANQPVQKNSNRLIPGAVHMETLPIPKQRDAQPTRERNRASSENRGNRVRQMVETSVDSGHSSNYVRLEANIDHPGLFAKLAGGQLPQGEKVGNESPRSKSSSKKSSQELSPLPPSKFKTPPMSPKSSEVSRLRQLRQTMSRSLYNEATESHVQLDSGPSYLPLSSSTEHGHHLGGEGEQESVVPYPPLRSPILTTNYSIQAPDKENNRLATQSKRPRSAVTQATRSFRPAALPAGSGDWGNKTTSPVSTSSSNGHDRRYHPRSPPPSAPPLAKSEIFDDDTPWLASGDSYDRDITIGRRPRCSTTSSGSNHHQHQSNNSPMDIRTKRAPPNQLPSPLLRTSPSSHCDLSSGGSTGSSSAGHHFSAATTPASPTGYSPRGGAGTRDTATLERGQMSASHSPLDMIRGALIPRSNHSNNGTHHQQPGRKGRSSSTLRRSCSYESISTEHNSSTSKQPSQKKTSIGLQLLRQIGLKRIRKFGSTAATNTAGNTPTSSGTRCPNGSGGCNDNVCGSCLPTASSPSGGNGGGVNLCCPPSSACSTQFKYR
ncbi:uncharacterized protein LOC142341419 isoform X3 [Convolutriloba macropyga]|uniref:uncharacterized protein LOC142341419 isoform X3 n=1 Tax=Convolutriloba macropyga TaxID=536237 RepID=UPI003F524826